MNGDQKAFGFTTESFQGEVGFAVVETTDDAVILDRIDELLPEVTTRDDMARIRSGSLNHYDVTVNHLAQRAAVRCRDERCHGASGSRLLPIQK